MPSCQSIGVKLGPTEMSVCERCMKGKARGGRVAEEENQGGNEIEALHESAMPFVLVLRGEAQADGDVGVQAVLLCHSCHSTGVKLGPTVTVCEQQWMKINEGADEMAEEESHDGNEIDWDDDDDEEWRY
ncbi:hypothetical protein Syun_013840 [Stephania yunnanensis]|uniref:Uncharacterized protein n=1 Tax=Stephania yunnanensis TaxID=152371 RepID=A0AAP0JIZ0_9MAGN